MTEFQKAKINNYECEPRICIPDKCNPNICFNIIKNNRKTFKDISISAKQEVKTKLASTDAQENSIANRCFCILMNKKITNNKIPEKLPDYSIKERGQKLKLGTPYEKINEQSKNKNLICKCFTKLKQINSRKESIIALTRKSAVYKRSQYQKNLKKKCFEAHIQATEDLKLHNNGIIETLMPYSKKKFKKSRSKMTFNSFYESENQELVTKMFVSRPKRYEYKNFMEQNEATSKNGFPHSIRSKYRNKLRQNIWNRIDKEYISSTETSSVLPNTVKFATPYEKLNEQTMGKNILCKCFDKFRITKAKKENTVPLTRKPAVYKRVEYHKNLKKEAIKTNKKTKQDLVLKNLKNLETLMPYSKKKFKKNSSRMTFGGIYESKNQELFTEVPISASIRYKNKKIKELKKVSEISLSNTNRVNENNKTKKHDILSSNIFIRQLKSKYKNISNLNASNKIVKHYISKIDMPISGPKSHKYEVRTKQSTNKIGFNQPPDKHEKGVKRSVPSKHTKMKKNR